MDIKKISKIFLGSFIILSIAKAAAATSFEYNLYASNKLEVKIPFTVIENNIFDITPPGIISPHRFPEWFHGKSADNNRAVIAFGDINKPKGQCVVAVHGIDTEKNPGLISFDILQSGDGSSGFICQEVDYGTIEFK